jgi:hypothetical protein
MDGGSTPDMPELLFEFDCVLSVAVAFTEPDSVAAPTLTPVCSAVAFDSALAIAASADAPLPSLSTTPGLKSALCSPGATAPGGSWQ